MVALYIFILTVLCSPSFAGTQPISMKANWTSFNGTKELKIWTLQEIYQFKTMTVREKDPNSLHSFQWKGVLLTSLIDQVMNGLSTEERAQIDLIILKNHAGAQIQFPRAFTAKYPVLLIFQKEGRSLLMADVFQSMILSASRLKAAQENLPVESFFLSGLREIEFANYREKFESSFLKLRTDPLALRGEKLFIQNCLACHTGGADAARLRQLASPKITSAELLLKNHQKVKLSPTFKSRDWRSLEVYFQARLSESAPEGDLKRGAQ